MPNAIQYDLDKLESFHSKRLGNIYINAFKTYRREPDKPTQLEAIVLTLSKREIEQRMKILNLMIEQLNICISQENYEQAAIYRDMIHFYEERVI